MLLVILNWMCFLWIIFLMVMNLQWSIHTWSFSWPCDQWPAYVKWLAKVRGFLSHLSEENVTILIITSETWYRQESRSCDSSIRCWEKRKYFKSKTTKYMVVYIFINYIPMTVFLDVFPHCHINSKSAQNSSPTNFIIDFAVKYSIHKYQQFGFNHQLEEV